MNTNVVFIVPWRLYGNNQLKAVLEGIGYHGILY